MPTPLAFLVMCAAHLGHGLKVHGENNLIAARQVSGQQNELGVDTDFSNPRQALARRLLAAPVTDAFSLPHAPFLAFPIHSTAGHVVTARGRAASMSNLQAREKIQGRRLHRRDALGRLLAIPAASTFGSAATARNLPEATGASAASRGTTESLVPVVLLSIAVSSAIAALPDLQKVARALDNLPNSERDFKRVFDEYSEGISYKQQYLDKNAFLVYYTKGFDGVGRDSIETESSAEKKQKEQYGARNEAWLGVDDARSEIAFLFKNPTDDDNELNELREALKRADKAFSSYLSLAPAEQVTAAKKMASP